MNLMENLLNLHRVDAQVRGLRRRVDAAQRYVDAQQMQYDALVAQLEELEMRKKQYKASILNGESEVAAIDERIEKLRGELNSSVTNKQYTAILTELNTVKMNRAEVEEHTIGIMEQVETADEELKGVRRQLEERGKVRDQAVAELAERRSEVGARLAELEAERETAASDVPGTELAAFERLAADYDGEAMAPIEEMDRRNRMYACGACNIQIPFEQVSTLITGSSVLVQCNACQRILYIQEEMRGALVKK